jgi:hypothetical protein
MKYFEIAFTPFIADTVMTDPAYRSKTRMRSQEREVVDHSNHSIPIQIFKGNRVIPNLCTSSPDLGMRVVFSGKAKRIFEKFDNEVIRFYSCPCSHRSVRLEDFWISDIIKSMDALIDFEKSSWILSKRQRDSLTGVPTKEFKKIITIHKFSSLIEFLDFRDNNLEISDRIEYQHLFIKPEAEVHVLFLYEAGPTNLIISEVLKDELIKNKLTKGVEFRPIEISRIEWNKARKS